MSVTRGTQHDEQSGSGYVTPQSSAGAAGSAPELPLSGALLRFALPADGKVCIEPQLGAPIGPTCQQSDGKAAAFPTTVGVTYSYTVENMTGFKPVAGQVPALAAGEARTITIPAIPEDKPATFDSLPNFGAIVVLGGLAVGIGLMNRRGR